MTKDGVPNDEVWMARMKDGILSEDVIFTCRGSLES